jgi:hypothetical protein
MAKLATELEILWDFTPALKGPGWYHTAPDTTDYGKEDIHKIIRLVGDSLWINVNQVLDHAHVELLFNAKATAVDENEPVFFEMIGTRYNYQLVIWKNLVGVLYFDQDWNWVKSVFAEKIDEVKDVLGIMVADCLII